MKNVFCLLFVVASFCLHAQSQSQFSSTSGNRWLTPGNWSTAAVPGSTDIAIFDNYPGSGNAYNCYIDFNDPLANNGTGGQAIGAIRVLASRTAELNIGNASPERDGILTLTGETTSS